MVDEPIDGPPDDGADADGFDARGHRRMQRPVDARAFSIRHLCPPDAVVAPSARWFVTLFKREMVSRDLLSAADGPPPAPTSPGSHDAPDPEQQQ
jgi:hypothetical protein